MIKISGWHILGARGVLRDRSFPGWSLLDVNIASNSATLDFTSLINSDFHTYVFEITNVLPANDDQGLWMRVSEDAGANWKSGASDYDWVHIGRSAGTNQTSNDTADSEIELIDSGFAANLAVGNASTEGANGNVYMYNPASTAAHKRFFSEMAWSNANGNAGIATVNGIYKSANAINGVRFLFETGNIASGSIRMYGIRR